VGTGVIKILLTATSHRFLITFIYRSLLKLKICFWYICNRLWVCDQPNEKNGMHGMPLLVKLFGSFWLCSQGQHIPTNVTGSAGINRRNYL